MLYLANAFSLGMLDCLSETGEVNLNVQSITIEDAKGFLNGTWESCVGHADTALLLSEMLGAKVEMRRVSTSLEVGDRLVVAQYNGPRLPEGATSLPEGAKIRWMIVTVR